MGKIRSAWALLPGVLVAARAVGAEWSLAASSTAEQPVAYAAFLDPRDGITVGVHGAVFYTRDGGRSWTEGINVSQCRHGLERLGEFAWHCGNVSVRRSFDGGKTWYRAASFGAGEPDHARFISFADENRGLIATDRRIGVTDDGGVHWTEVRPPKGVGELAAVSMALAPQKPGVMAVEAAYAIRPVVGRLLDAAGRMWRTDDAGEHWTEVASPLRGRPFEILADGAVTALRFDGAGEGLLAAFVKRPAGLVCRIFRSTDAGGSWTEDEIDLSEIGTLFIAPDLRHLTHMPVARPVPDHLIQIFERQR